MCFFDGTPSKKHIIISITRGKLIFPTPLPPAPRRGNYFFCGFFAQNGRKNHI